MNFGMTSALCQCVNDYDTSLCLLSGYWNVCQLVALLACMPYHAYLMRAHHVIKSDHDCWQSMTLHVAFYDHLSGCFAGRVRIRGI